MNHRPAETTTAAAAAAYLIAYAFGVLEDPTLLVSLTVLIGLLPGAVTAIVTARRRAGKEAKRG